ncbi:MAG: hypothetical protein NTZ10_01260 [Candidatus Saganbacteria bacterium]|nr:hypothetical protein [Candidatus Saganbacteria bacterium]
MKKLIFVLFVFLMMTVMFLETSFACWGYRPMGMGGTFVAVADDANCAYWNRAGVAQLDKWKNGENQIILTTRFLDNDGLFNREARVGNSYYDSVNFAHKINGNLGWTFAGEWSGGGAVALSPSIGFRLPWNETMSLGIGYFYYRSEDYGSPFGTRVMTDTVQNQIHLDYLWRMNKEWSLGVHCENFWLLSGYTTSPDIPGWKQEFSNSVGDGVNFRPSIAWMPEGKLKGLVVNAGIYDAFRSYGDPYYSAGFEYTPQAKDKENFWTRSSFRAGIYNYRTNPDGAVTLGYSYKIDDKLDIGYYSFLWLSADKFAANFNHNVGVAYKF